MKGVFEAQVVLNLFLNFDELEAEYFYRVGFY